MIVSLLADPCLTRYDPNLLRYLSTDFSDIGFGYSLTQPSCDAVSLAAMNREITWDICEFLDHKSEAKLCPVAFGSRRARG